MNRINGRTYVSLGGGFSAIEPTDPSDGDVHVWAYSGGLSCGSLILEPRVLRELAADLIKRADLLDTEFVEPR